MKDFLDKDDKSIKEGDILFYSENIFGKDNFHYADQIQEVYKIEDDKMFTITRVFTPACYGIGAKYEEIDDMFGCPLDIHDKRCSKIIGNIKDNPEMITVEFAEKNFSLKGKKIHG